MLKGEQLGAAIDAARIKKNLSKKALADRFGVKPPSVQGWISTGRIDKSKIFEMIAFFSDVVPPSHWGLHDGTVLLLDEAHRPGEYSHSALLDTPETLAPLDGYTATPKANSIQVALGRSLFEKITPRSKALIDRIMELESRGELTDEDFQVLEQIVKRFSSKK